MPGTMESLWELGPTEDQEEVEFEGAFEALLEEDPEDDLGDADLDEDELDDDDLDDDDLDEDDDEDDDLIDLDDEWDDGEEEDRQHPTRPEE